MVHVAYRDTERLTDSALSADLSVLSTDERTRHARFVFARDRRDFAAAHALLRRRLSMHAAVPPGAWAFEVEPGGKPHLDRSRFALDLTFNLSHTSGLAACGIAHGVDIGVDVESIDRAVDGQEIAARHFSAEEIEQLSGCDAAERQARFIELWTLKEAYVKAIARGLSHPLNDFGFAFDGKRGIRFMPPPGTQATQWTFVLLAPSVRHRLAVAVRSPSAVVRMTDDVGESGKESPEPLRASDW